VSEGTRSIWDEYRLLGERFRGPATVAWDAEHVISGRRARLTTIHTPPMASSVTAEAISSAFRRAAERNREFSHPDHLSIIGVAEQAGQPVAVTMLPDGLLLSERLDDQPDPLGDAMRQISRIAHSVAALHGLTPSGSSTSTLRHGYLIPENLWVRETGQVLLLDSGIHAAAAHAAYASGFPVAPCPYIPAQEDAYLDGNQTSDLYALVALLVRLATGRVAPAGRLAEAVQALPESLPASLRSELIDAITLPRKGETPNARSLAIHLAFDTTWMRAQERSRREPEIVAGEAAGPRSGTNRPSEEENSLRTWARSFPTAGVRGGEAMAPPASSGAIGRLGEAVRALVHRLALRIPGSTSPKASPNRAASPRVAPCAVRLGPYADRHAATQAHARLRGSWPAAAVIVDRDHCYVHVTTCPTAASAEELAARFREAGDPAQVSE
jgi:hypothetical protein